MRPQWFSVPSSARKGSNTIRTHDPSSSAPLPQAPPIPYDEMWAGDRYWIPLLLDGHHFVGREDFETVEGTEQLRRWWFGLSREKTSSEDADA
jgi:hypothetical protein